MRLWEHITSHDIIWTCNNHRNNSTCSLIVGIPASFKVPSIPQWEKFGLWNCVQFFSTYRSLLAFANKLKLLIKLNELFNCLQFVLSDESHNDTGNEFDEENEENKDNINRGFSIYENAYGSHWDRFSGNKLRLILKLLFVQNHILLTWEMFCWRNKIDGTLHLSFLQSSFSSHFYSPAQSFTASSVSPQQWLSDPPIPKDPKMQLNYIFPDPCFFCTIFISSLVHLYVRKFFWILYMESIKWFSFILFNILFLRCYKRYMNLGINCFDMLNV